jgi:hypothetical protein
MPILFAHVSFFTSYGILAIRKNVSNLTTKGDA